MHRKILKSVSIIAGWFSRIESAFHPRSSAANLSLPFVLAWLCLGAMPALALEDAPPVEKITDTLFRVGKVTVDTRAHTLTCAGEVNQDAGSIEYLAVAPGGKTHESLLRLEVRPLHLQVGLLLLGLEPKNVLRFQGDPTQPQGARVQVWIRWRDRAGKAREVRAEEWVSEESGSRALAPRTWSFTGSRIGPRGGFVADGEKSLIAVWHDPAAILDNPGADGGRNNHVVNAKRVRPRGTPIELVVRAITPENKPQ